jgi:hypothetical protein
MGGLVKQRRKYQSVERAPGVQTLPPYLENMRSRKAASHPC